MLPVKKLFSGMQRKDGNLNLTGQGTVQTENWCASRSTDPVSKGNLSI